MYSCRASTTRLIDTRFTAQGTSFDLCLGFVVASRLLQANGPIVRANGGGRSVFRRVEIGWQLVDVQFEIGAVEVS